MPSVFSCSCRVRQVCAVNITQYGCIKKYLDWIICSSRLSYFLRVHNRAMQRTMSRRSSPPMIPRRMYCNVFGGAGSITVVPWNRKVHVPLSGVFNTSINHHHSLFYFTSAKANDNNLTDAQFVCGDAFSVNISCLLSAAVNTSKHNPS